MFPVVRSHDWTIFSTRRKNEVWGSQLSTTSLQKDSPDGIFGAVDNPI